MLILGLALETTGLSHETDEIIELGAVAWDTEQNKPVAMINHLIQQPKKMPLEDIIVKITGITENDLNNFGISEQKAIQDYVELANKCDYVIAHNGNQFDKQFIEKALTRHGEKQQHIWLDSMTDVPYQTATRKLTYLAAEHKFLNPYSHRALFDVLTMLKVCSHYDWNEIITRAASPTVQVVAKVSKEDRLLAKKVGFRWDAKNYQWVKVMKEMDLVKTDFNFEIEVETITPG